MDSIIFKIWRNFTRRDSHGRSSFDANVVTSPVPALVWKLDCRGCQHAFLSAEPADVAPCTFCTRNSHRDADESLAGLRWYDDSVPVRVPMDCYCPPDLGEQLQAWLAPVEDD